MTHNSDVPEVYMHAHHNQQYEHQRRKKLKAGCPRCGARGLAWRVVFGLFVCEQCRYTESA